MIRILKIALLAQLSTASIDHVEASKEAWVHLGQVKGLQMEVFADKNSIKREGDVIRFTQLEMLRDLDESRIKRQRINCREKIEVTESWIQVKGRYGNGEQVYSNNSEKKGITLRAHSDKFCVDFDAIAKATPLSSLDSYVRSYSKSTGTSSEKEQMNSFLEATGNKAKVAPSIPEEQVLIVGPAAAPIKTVLLTCKHLVEITGPGKPGIGSIYKVEHFTAISSSSVPSAKSAQGQLFPIKLYANYRDGERLFTKAYLMKDAFGDFKCIAAN